MQSNLLTTVQSMPIPFTGNIYIRSFMKLKGLRKKRYFYKTFKILHDPYVAPSC